MKQRRVRFALFATFVIVCLIAAVPGFASQARIVRLSQIDGNVQIDRGGMGLEKAVLNMPVIEGTRLVAENDATAEVEFENGSTMRIVGPATVNFRELSLNGDGDKVSMVDLQPGIYYFDIKHKGNDDFRVDVASNEFRVKKSAHFRVQNANDEAKLAVFKGEVQLDGADKDVAIKSDETVTLDPMDAGKYLLAKGTDSLFSDSWDKERAEYRDRYADSDTWKYTNTRYGAPYSYGFSDLNYYGNYFNVPGYGWMWRPSMYDASWDPFSNGAWSYYPGQGWMFVSMYPWGWAPYRYGQWYYVPSYGWCWRPGGTYTYWNPVPVVRNPPSTVGWHRPHPPASTMTNTVLVNPAPTQPNGPTAGWRRPGVTTTQGFIDGRGITSPKMTTPEGEWKRVKPPAIVVQPPQQTNTGWRGARGTGDTDRQDVRGTSRRGDAGSVPPQQQQRTVAPPQQQRTVAPPPARQESRPAPAPPRVEHAPSGGWHTPSAGASAGGGHHK